MPSQRFLEQLQSFEKALASLHLALAQLEDEFVRDSIIQRFEFSFEMAWKCMFRWLKDQGENVAEMTRPVIQAAFRAGIITDANTWEKLKDYRDETSHTYNERKAAEVVAFVRKDAVFAFDALLVGLKQRP